jgi:site-specific recombinase XerD
MSTFISRHKNGYWYLFYDDENGIRRRKSTKSRTKSGALKFMRSYIPSVPKGKKISLPVFESRIIGYVTSHHKRGTVTIYRQAFKHLRSVIGNVPVDRIGAVHVDTFKTVRMQTVRPATLRIDLATLKAAFNLALRWEVVAVNPFARVKMPTTPEVAPIFFPRDEFEGFARTINEKWLRDLVTFGAYTGLRRGELVNLKRSAVDRDRKIIAVKLSDTFRTKTDRERTVTMCNRALEIFDGIDSRGEYVFTLNGKQIDGHWASELLKRYIKRSKLQESALHFHSLRHSFASWLVQDGVSLFAVKELLGHTDIKTTQIYTHLQRSHLHDAVSVLDK